MTCVESGSIQHKLFSEFLRHCEDVSLWDSAPPHRKTKTSINNSAFSEMLEKASFLLFPALIFSSPGRSIGESLCPLGWLWCSFLLVLVLLCFHFFQLPLSSPTPPLLPPGRKHPRRGLSLFHLILIHPTHFSLPAVGKTCSSIAQDSRAAR